ncbi:hypothetical protein CDO09_22885 [Xanthomonas perforans]|nr:hypothetical protein CDO09_22885 [Xanthomonas perforans]
MRSERSPSSSLSRSRRLRKRRSPRDRLFYFSLSPLSLGPLGFIVRPQMARRGLRRAERLHPQEAYAARWRDQRFTAAQWRLMTA